MEILVLDTIHGGTVIGDALCRMGHHVDLVDVYRGDLTSPGSITPETASSRKYDLLIHPVHLNPAYPLLRQLPFPAITHHDAVRWILREHWLSNHENRGPVIEVTGTRGKTTTATALASILTGPGILHTSRGTFRYPDEELLTRMSITPASLIIAESYTRPGDWFIGEVSLGFTGIADLAILTSDEDYRVGADRFSAREIKHMSSLKCPHLLVAPDIRISHDHLDNAADLVKCNGMGCEYHYQGMDGLFENPLMALEGYRIPLQMAAAGSLILGDRPDDLSTFTALPGRLQVKTEDGKTIIDNACSGASLKTTEDAMNLLKKNYGNPVFTLVIGQEEHAVCENFPARDINTAIRKGKPASVILVAGDERLDKSAIYEQCLADSIPVRIATSLANGVDTAKTMPPSAIVVSVKTWR